MMHAFSTFLVPCMALFAVLVPASSSRGDEDDVSPPDSPEDLVEAEPIYEQPPIRWLEIIALLLIVALADLTIYRGHGFAGLAMFFAAVAILFPLGSPRPCWSSATWITGAFLLLVAARLFWAGTSLLVTCGFFLVVGLAMALAGLVPYVPEGLVFVFATIRSGFEGLKHYFHKRENATKQRRNPMLSVLLPAVLVIMFGMLFVLSNPDLRDAIFDGFERFYAQLSRWWRDLEFSVWEVAFWIAVTWIAVGMLRPVFMQKLRQVRMQQWKLLFEAPKTKATDSEPRESLWFRPWHNALIAVIVLFAVYLVFEFTTLWFKEFPEGFYYAGYAHEGAAWLTVALALATVVMSIIFRGEILRDPRIGRLRLLSWIWSAQNFLLAAAVYNRLLIYVGFNGMTFMRTIGFFGITTVVVGFFLVLWKIIYQRDFFWLLQRQLWALAAAGLIFALTPVDTIVYRYNTQRIMAGELAPSVQISVHPIDMGGILQILPLVECDNEIIREGVLAMLAERQMEAEQLVHKRRQRGWTTFQLRDRFALETLESYEPRWQVYRDRAKRDLALSKFHEYVYQWY